MIALTEAQEEILNEVPDFPSDGIFCKGPRFRVAEALVRKGLVRCVGSGVWGGGYYVRTVKGSARARGAK